jgi:cytochrome c peroxidase
LYLYNQYFLMNSYIKVPILVISLIFLSYCKTENSIIPSDEVSLGEKLFFETKLSRDNTVSCGTCHKPEFAFADNKEFSVGVRGQLTTRNTPSSINVSAHSSFFWDGRAETLEEQTLGPIESRGEMDSPISEVVAKLNMDPLYRSAFYKVYGSKPSKEAIISAIAAFEMSLETADTPFDHYMQGDTNAVSAAAKRGQLIFNVKGKCFDCHFGPDFTADDFKNIGLFDGGKTWNDSGRFLITRNVNDLGKFKTPGLRNIAKTSPYMHNGKFKSLQEVIDYYNDPNKIVPMHQNRDTILNQPLGLTKAEKSDLLMFLNSLTDKRFEAKP